MYAQRYAREKVIFDLSLSEKWRWNHRQKQSLVQMIIVNHVITFDVQLLNDLLSVCIEIRDKPNLPHYVVFPRLNNFLSSQYI